MTTADLGRLAHGAVWCPSEAPAPVRFAARELATYVGRLTGLAPAIRTVPGDAARLWLQAIAPEQAPPLPDDATAARFAGDDRLALAGATPRDLLWAVYRLLEDTGCRWSPRGPQHEHVPAPPAANRGVASALHRPAFARRAYASDLTTWHYSMPERYDARLPQDLAFVDWMAKTGATGWLFIRHAHDDRWLIPPLTDALHARGLAAEWGGHALVEWLPRAAFAGHPEFFPLGPDGRRTDMGNCCTASAAALALVGDGVRAARAEVCADDLHVWGLDLFGGGWCHCPDCIALSPSDQALRLTNAVAATLPSGERVFHLAYHDTIHAPVRVAPDPRVWAEFAPRERCYEHALDDHACDVNRPYRAALEAHLERFDGRVDVFEYYADAILFGGCAAPLADVVGRDLEFYRRAGVGGVSCLTFGRFSQLAYGVNLEAFARSVVGPIDATAARAAHDADAFAGTAAAIPYLAALERLVAPLLGGGDVKLPPRHGARAPHVRSALHAALAARPGLEAQLDGLPPGSRRDAEHALLRYTMETIAGLSRLLDAGDDDQAVEHALDELRAAVAAFERTDPEHLGTWGGVDLGLTHAFFEGMLRGSGTLPDPFADPIS